MGYELENRDYLRNEIVNYALVKDLNGENKRNNQEMEFRSRLTLKGSPFSGLIKLASIPAAASLGVGFAGVGLGAYMCLLAEKEAGAQILNVSGDILKYGLYTLVLPVPITSIAIKSEWCDQIRRNREQNKRDAILTQELIREITGERSRRHANKEEVSFLIALSLYQDVNLSSMKKKDAIRLLKRLAAYRDVEKKFTAKEAKIEDVEQARNVFFSCFEDLCSKRNCPNDLKRNRTIILAKEMYDEQRREKLAKQQIADQGLKLAAKARAVKLNLIPNEQKTGFAPLRR